MNRRYTRFNWVLLVLTGIVAASAVAQKPNFSGTWNLNLSKSFVGSDHPSSNYQLTKVIVQNGNEFTITDIAVHQTKVNIPLPDSRLTTTFMTDAKEREAQGVSPFPGIPAPTLMVSAEWQGGTLFIKERGGSGSAPPTVAHRRYFLSEDHAELVEVVESHSTFGDAEQRFVFDRQP
jgi:hypothetical protein